MRIGKDIRHFQELCELGQPDVDSLRIKIRMSVNDAFNVRHVARPVRDSLHDNEVFRARDRDGDVTDCDGGRSFDRLFFKREGAEGNIHINTALLVTQK